MRTRSVEIAAEGAVLRGELSARGSDFVVCVHEIDSDLDAYRPLRAMWLGEDEVGPSLLAFDLRGHGGSDGEFDPARLAGDLATVIRFARAEGAGHVCLVAAGTGAPAAISASQLAPVDALVLLSPDLGAAPPDTNGSALSSTLCAKLVLYGSGNDKAEEDSGVLLKASVGPATRVAFPTSEQGTALLEGEWSVHVLDRIRYFVDEQRHLAADPLRRR